MKRVLLIATVLFTTACDASTTKWDVQCENPFEMRYDHWTDEVESATTFNSGTRIVFKDGHTVDYSISVKCRIEQREEK